MQRLGLLMHTVIFLSMTEKRSCRQYVIHTMPLKRYVKGMARSNNQLLVNSSSTGVYSTIIYSVCVTT